jgi:uroporphyrinogen-III synthase
MMGLEGMRVALLENRKQSELALMVQRFGGVPYCVPAVQEQHPSCSEEVLALLENLERESSYVVVFSSAVGVSALFAEAERLERLFDLRSALERGTVICRGPKPIDALKRAGVNTAIPAKEPFTIAELSGALAPRRLESQFVVLLHYGERNVALAESLFGHCTGLQELLVCNWHLPEDTSALHKLVKELIAGRVGAIAFTSRLQVRHLFAIACEDGLGAELLDALEAHVLVATVGPTCATALEALGVVPQVVPEYPKMGAMIERLAHYVSEQRGAA